MNKIYFDNASTSFPKAPGVVDNMRFFMEELGCNLNRGEYTRAYSAASVVLDTREKLCRLFDFPSPRNVVFTANITYALNFLIKGLFKQGDHVLVSSMEHNAMMRPLVQMIPQGVTFDRIPCNGEGELLTGTIPSLIRPRTKAILMLHASNICGTVMPLEQISKIAQSHGLYFIVDTAQTAGIFPISMTKLHIDALAFTGHKSLLGPQGIGGMIITDELAEQTEPLISGGTGSISDSEDIPSFLPDRFEAGTMNLPGIYGLNAALSYLQQTGIDTIRQKEQALTARLQEGLSRLPQIRIVGTPDAYQRASIVSIDCLGYDNAEIAFLLDSKYGIMTRCGMHCAPNAHKTLGTFPQGTVRFSLGYGNTSAEVDKVIEAMEQVLSQASKIQKH